MLQEIKKFIMEKENGIFLLDSPTGFGKTTAVINFLEDYIVNNEFDNKKRVFFITNLKINLPWKELKQRLGDEVFNNNCIVLESLVDNVIEKWEENANNIKKEIKETKEYKSLNEAIELLLKERKVLNDLNSSDSEKQGAKFIINNIYNNIQEKSEPQFRNFIKRNYFYGKFLNDKKSFIQNNSWFSNLYPSCVMEKYRVIFMTTAKFSFPIDMFYKLPIFLPKDELMKNSILFIDEFDATKDVFLNNIIKQSLETKIDLLKLFLEIYYSLQHLKWPKQMMIVSEELKKSIDKGRNYKKPNEIIEEFKRVFEEFYKVYNLSFAIKSERLEKDRAFLFYDGSSFTILKDNSKGKVYIKNNSYENVNELYIADQNLDEEKDINKMIKELNGTISYFTIGLVYLAENFMNYKNSIKGLNDSKYTIEESIMTILSLFNISNEFKDIIFQSARDYHFGNYYFMKYDDEDTFMRKGFKFTEIEDDRLHDLQSIFHAFFFRTTPEDILVSIAKKGNIVGVSATASLETIIGNYDISYLKSILNDNFYTISEEGKNRINNEFSNQQKVYDDENIVININVVDDIDKTTDDEKTRYIIENDLGLSDAAKEELIKKYDECLKQIKSNDSKESKEYYSFIKYKIASCYRSFGKSDKMKSFLCFINFSINKETSKIKEDEINKLFEKISTENEFEYVQPIFISAANYDSNFQIVRKNLAEGKKVFIISTYKTIGTGKNIQYEIPESVIQNVLIDDNSQRNDKDFDAIYLSTPTNLIMNLRYDSSTKYEDLAKYLFQQEYLRQKKYIPYYKMKQNIIRGFKITFYNIKDIYFSTNHDQLFNNAQIIIQAVGRICRCRNKNKDINIFCDFEVLRRLQRIRKELSTGMYNREFISLLNKELRCFELPLAKYSSQNKKAAEDIKNKAYKVRHSEQNIIEWKEIREYILRNPTVNKDKIDDKYELYYFGFDKSYSGYSYNFDTKGNLDNIDFDFSMNFNEVSDRDCDLGLLLKISCIAETFKEKGYAKKFLKGEYIMCPAIYKQIYLGALGEVACKSIIEKYTSCHVLIDIKDIDKFELFDYVCGDCYFDFKNWRTFITNNNVYCEKIRRKLNKVSGKKCFIINLTCQEGTKYSFQEIYDGIYVVPFLIDPDTGDISINSIDFLIEKIGEDY